MSNFEGERMASSLQQSVQFWQDPWLNYPYWSFLSKEKIVNGKPIYAWNPALVKPKDGALLCPVYVKICSGCSKESATGGKGGPAIVLPWGASRGEYPGKQKHFSPEGGETPPHRWRNPKQVLSGISSIRTGIPSWTHMGSPEPETPQTSGQAASQIQEKSCM